jgi:hypothetical protein
MTPGQWRKARETLDFTTPKTPDSAPVTPAEQAAPTGASQELPASEAGDGVEQPKRRKGADSRIQELLAERAQLRASQQDLQSRLEALERRPTQDAPKDSSPTAVKAEWQRFAEMADAPKEDAFDRYADYTAAMSLFIADKRFEERDQRVREQSQMRQVQQQFERVAVTAAEKYQTYVKAHADAAERIHPDLQAIVPISLLPPNAPKGPHNFIAEEILKSDVPGPLMVHFSEHPEDFDRLTRMGPAGIVREIGKLEAKLDSGSPQPVATATPPPPPPPTLGRKPGAPVDDLKAATDRGDFRAFREAYNRRHAKA